MVCMCNELPWGILLMFYHDSHPILLATVRHYRKTSSKSRTLVDNKIVDNSDVVGASPVGAAPTTSSFSTKHLALMDWAKATARGAEKPLSFGIWCDLN